MNPVPPYRLGTSSMAPGRHLPGESNNLNCSSAGRHVTWTVFRVVYHSSYSQEKAPNSTKWLGMRNSFAPFSFWFCRAKKLSYRDSWGGFLLLIAIMDGDASASRELLVRSRTALFVHVLTFRFAYPYAPSLCFFFSCWMCVSLHIWVYANTYKIAR